MLSLSFFVRDLQRFHNSHLLKISFIIHNSFHYYETASYISNCFLLKHPQNAGLCIISKNQQQISFYQLLYPLNEFPNVLHPVFNSFLWLQRASFECYNVTFSQKSLCFSRNSITTCLNFFFPFGDFWRNP